MTSAVTARSRGVPWLAGVWCVTALWFAWHRAPYDDEWFSIELALQADPAHFWQALQADVHPPWIAVLDRWLGGLWHSRLALQALRVAVSALAFGVSAPWLSETLRVPRWIWLAAFHPIVFMYAGSARWYPFLLLAHALRARALWGADRAWIRRVTFLVGSAVGAAATYLDPWFLAHDCVWWIARAWRTQVRSARFDAVAIVAFAAACVIALQLSSPLGPAHALGFATPLFSLRSAATWLGLGAIGEAGPAWPWLLLGSVAPIMLARAIWFGLRERDAGPLSTYLLSCILVWAVAAGCFGAWHARYGLWLWFAWTAIALALWRRSQLDRAGLALLASYFALVLGLMVSGHGFYKADLEALGDDGCRVLQQDPKRGLVIASYAGLDEWARTRCGVSKTRVLRIPSLRIVPKEQEQLSVLRAALATQMPTFWLLSAEGQSSLSVTNARVRALLATACHVVGHGQFGAVPHLALKRALGESPATGRLLLERWACP